MNELPVLMAIKGDTILTAIILLFFVVGPIILRVIGALMEAAQGKPATRSTQPERPAGQPPHTLDDEIDDFLRRVDDDDDQPIDDEIEAPVMAQVIDARPAARPGSQRAIRNLPGLQTCRENGTPPPAFRTTEC